MAGIDKIYGTQAQYNELWDWIVTHGNKYNAVQSMLPLVYPPPEGGPRIIANFSTKEDRWLWKECQMPWLRERLAYQYGAKGPPPTS